MNMLLFSVGIFVFMITVYGVVMAGGFMLWKIRRAEAAPHAEFVVNDDGYEVIVARPEHAPGTGADPYRDERSRIA